MIDKILESNFERLDSLYNAIMEAEAPNVLGKYRDQRVTPTYLYLILERFLKGSRTGIYLSPASWLRKRSIFFLDKHAKHVNSLIEAGEDRESAEEKAVKLTEAEIYDEIEAEKDKLRREEPTLSEDEIQSKVNRMMPYHTNIPTWTEMSFDSQQIGDQEVHLGSGSIAKSSELPLPEVVARGRSGESSERRFLEFMRKVVRVRDAAPTWHDPNISKMVIFGDGSSIPPRTRTRLDILRQKVEDVSGEIERLSASDDPAERAMVSEKEKDLRYYRHKISNMSIGVWRPEDLNHLVYGSEEPLNPSEVDASRVIDLPGLIPNLYVLIGGQEGLKTKSTEALGVEVGGEKAESHQSSHIDDLIERVRRTKKTREEKEKEIEKLKEMRGEWRKTGGDLRKISADLYTIVVKYIIDHIPKTKDRSLLKGIIPESGLPTVIVGNTRYSKKKKGKTTDWDEEGSDIKDPSDRTRELNNLAAIQDVNIGSQYNMGSVLKRVSIAQMLAEAIDQSIYQWVLNKVGDGIYKIADPSNAGVLNIGSDPGVVNNFICSIDQIESRYGLDARMSWYLIPFIDKHKSYANQYFSEAQPITSGTKFGEKPVEFGDFRKWNTGVLDFENKTIVRDKSGHPIRITGEGFDYYMNLALHVATEEGKIDTDELYANSTEIDLKVKQLKNITDKLNDNYSNIESLEDELKKSEGDEAATKRIGMELAKIKAAHKKIEKDRTKIEQRISDLERYSNDSWGTVFDIAKSLQQLGPRALETIEKRQKGKIPFNEDVFMAWLKESPERMSKLEEAQKEALDTGSEEAQLKLERTRRDLEKEFRSLTSKEPEEKENLPSQEAKEIIKRLAEPYADYDYKRLAEMATERINKDKPEEEWQEITPSQVQLVFGEEGIDRQRGNIMSFAINALRDKARETAGSEDTASVSNHMKRLIEEDSSKFFISAIVEMLTAIVEMNIVESSQTNMFGGGGLKTEVSYKDEHGALHLPPGWDSGEIYGQRSNPYAVIRQKRRYIEELQDSIDNGELVGEELEEAKREIEKQEVLIEEYRRKMLDNPNIQRLADRAEAISGPDNPLLPQNKEYLDQLIEKMKAHFAGEEVEWNAPVSEESDITWMDMAEFLHKHTPLMQSMGINIARVAGRYLVPIRRSIDVQDIAGQPPTNSKNITDLGAMNTSNVLTGLLGMIGADKYLHSLDEIFESNGINKALETISVPTRIVPYLAMELALWANGSKVKGGLGVDGADLTREFIKSKLFEYLSLVKVPQDKINRVTNLIVEQMIKLSAPTKQDIEASRELYRSLRPLFGDMLNGTETLANYVSLPYNPADIKIIADLVEGIKKMREGEKVEDMEKRVRDFIDFSNNLEIDKDSEEVFANCLDDLGDIDRLDNMNYLIDKAQYLEAMYDEADESTKESISSELEVVNGKIRELASELEDRSIILDVDNKQAMLVSIASYRERARNKIESRIERYKDVPTEELGISADKIDTVAGKLHQFRNIINASASYHRARSDADRAITDEEKKEAKKKQAEAHREISGSMDELKLDIGESDAASMVHKFTTGDMTEFSKQYRERQELYDRMIDKRNNILGRGTTPEKVKEEFVSIYRKLIEMTKHYNKKPEDITSELLDRAAQFEKGVEFKKEKRRRAEKAFGGVEMEVVVKIPGDNEEKIMAAIFPREVIVDKLETILNSGDLEVTMLNPALFLRERTDVHPEYGKTTIYVHYNNVSELEKGEGKPRSDLINPKVFKPKDETIILPGEDFSIDDKMSIVRDQEINVEEHEKIIDYLSTKSEVPVVISFR